MIGTYLTKNEMKTIINKLEFVEQPWNCPHGIIIIIVVL